jgi:prepilin-type N-terminal cleavage/methylation domain-containing protein
MKFASIGTRAVFRSLYRRQTRTRGGFTLLETLVALAVVLAFAAAIGPFLLYARRIMVSADDRVAAQALLRALLDDPVDVTTLANLSRDGETAGLRWHLGAEPSGIGTTFRRAAAANSIATPGKSAPQPNWLAYRVVATVTFGGGRTVSAETVRLGKPE